MENRNISTRLTVDLEKLDTGCGHTIASGLLESGASKDLYEFRYADR